MFINYGFVTRAVQALMHPRSGLDAVVAGAQRSARRQLLAFVRERGAVHPRAVDRHFSHGSVTNYWGGSSSATTHLLEAMHYRGLLRVARREDGIRIYEPHEHGRGRPTARRASRRSMRWWTWPCAAYAPLPAASLSSLVSRLRYAAPQWRGELRAALARAKRGWPMRGSMASTGTGRPASSRRAEAPQEVVRLLAPFDPLVWDRRRFEMLWGWAYRFEAYTPAHKRKLGYYALPLLWRDRVIGWGNVSVKNGGLMSDLGYVGSRPRDAAFKRELEAELARVRLSCLDRRPERVRSGGEDRTWRHDRVASGRSGDDRLATIRIVDSLAYSHVFS